MNLMKTARALAAVALATIGFASPSHATATFFWSSGSACSNAATVAFSPGGPTFQASLCASTTTERGCGFSAILQSSAAAESNAFSVTARTLGTIYSDVNSVPGLPLLIANPPTIADFGATIPTGGSSAAPGANQLLATFTFQPQASATNASYLINLSPVSEFSTDQTVVDCRSAANSGAALPSLTLNLSTGAVFFTSAATTTFTVATAGTFNVTATGTPTPTYTATGALPNGVTFTTAGVLAGTPASGSAGTYPLTITAANANQQSSSQNYSLVVAKRPQSITFGTLAARQLNASPFTVTNASASSGLPLNFASSTTGVCTVAAAGVTLLTEGTCTISANQAGNIDFSAAVAVVQSFAVGTSVPAAPTIGAATPGTTTATIAFTAPANNGGSAIIDYTATCSGGAGGSATGTASPLTVSGLATGTTYTCSVTARNAVGISPASAPVTVTLSAIVLPGAPAAPTIGTGTPVNNAATITFTAPVNNGGSAIIDYTATCSGGAGGSVTGPASPLTITGLVSGTTYICSVTARNAVGAGPASATVTVILGAVVPPGAPTITTASLANTEATIAFAAPASIGGSPITGYTATCNPGAISASASGSPITVTGLATNTIYTCSVSATNAAGSGVASATVTITPINAMMTLTSNTNAAGYGAPVTLTASVTGNGQTGTVALSVIANNGEVVTLPGCAAVPLVAGLASCTAPGSYQNQSVRQYFAVYSGDASNTSASTVLLQTVALNNAVLTLAATPLPPIVSGRTTTLTALVRMNSPAGTVTFFDNGVPITGCAQTALSLLPDAVDAAVATCIVVAPVVPIGVKQYMATYFYPTGHISGRVFEQITYDLRVVATGPLDYTDMWWAGASENGWGMSVMQHGPIQFNVIFAYDNAGKSLWYVMPGGSFNAAGTVFTGPLYLPTSSPFSAYDKSKFVIGAPIGSATITYTSSSIATLNYTISGISVTKQIQRQIFATETGGPNLRTNDLWWGTFAENGWGMNVSQQGRVLFPVWYTYDAAGKATFFTVQGGSWSGTVWSGTIYSHASSPWLGVPYNPAAFTSTTVGTMSLDFTDASNATMTTTVHGITQVRPIERQPY